MVNFYTLNIIILEDKVRYSFISHYDGTQYDIINRNLSSVCEMMVCIFIIYNIHYHYLHGYI